MARLAGSPVPVPITFRSTSGAWALNPGPSSVLCTSTTFTSAPIATLSRGAADAGTARTTSRAKRLTSIGCLLVGGRRGPAAPRSAFHVLVHPDAVRRDPDRHRAFPDPLRAVRPAVGAPPPRAGAAAPPQRPPGRAPPDPDGTAREAVVRQAVAGHVERAPLPPPLEPG